MTAYIGVSGFMRSDEVRGALAVFPDCGRSLMVGVLVSAKTLSGQRNKYPNRYPLVEDIADIFTDDPRCLNLIHYASDVPPSIETVRRLYDICGPNLHGFQFNVAWPHRCVMSLAREFAWSRPPRFVFQVKPGDPPPFPQSPTDVLLDASGGRGSPIDVAMAFAELDLLRDELPGVRLGAAGGLCADTVGALVPLLAEHPCLNFDAEGRLRTVEDNLDMDKVRAYLRASADLVRLRPLETDA